MASPKSGTAGSAVAPAAPNAADDADSADPGAVSSAKADPASRTAAKYAKTKVKPHKPPESAADRKKLSWIEIELVDEGGKPVSGEAYSIDLPDGSVASGTLDQAGFARVEGVEPGTCEVSFPRLDSDTWKRA